MHPKKSKLFYEYLLVLSRSQEIFIAFNQLESKVKILSIPTYLAHEFLETIGIDELGKGKRSGQGEESMVDRDVKGKRSELKDKREKRADVGKQLEDKEEDLLGKLVYLVVT